MKKVVRSISGVVPLAVMLKPYPCPHGKCIYCPSQPGVPESYTETSPVVLRAKECEYDPYKQVRARLRVLGVMGHSLDKIELIVMGGTFGAYPIDYQYSFIKGCFDGLNGFKAQDLSAAHRANEHARHRCVGLCVETRPDYCTQEHIDRFLSYGCTRVELGVQLLDDQNYALTKRGHSVEDVVRATARLKDCALKVGYHVMLGLPGSSPQKDLQNFKLIFEDERFKPDQIKIYPCFVIRGTKLEKLYRQGGFEPYDTETIIDLLIKIKRIVPAWVRIMRVMRDIPAQYIVSDCKYSHLRDAVRARMAALGLNCNCIRCREVGHAARAGKKPDRIELKKIEYRASGGKEIFLSLESENGILISLLRLRLPARAYREELCNTALVREMHTFGPLAKLGQPGQWQHRGCGRALLEQAERIARQSGADKIAIISGVGVREYFRKFGYRLEGPYMTKTL